MQNNCRCTSMLVDVQIFNSGCFVDAMDLLILGSGFTLKNY